MNPQANTTPTDTQKDSVRHYVAEMGERARQASREMANAGVQQKNDCLHRLAHLIDEHRSALKKANRNDIERATASGCDAAFIDRLTLCDQSIATMVDGIHQIIALADPIGEITQLRKQPSGISVGHMRVPLGVIGIIYESRPNVTIDAGALCIKAGNATILRGGSLIGRALESVSLPSSAVQVVDRTDREAVSAMITMPQYIDVIVPRGGKSLIERIMQEAKVPVIKHLDGICHVYIDNDACPEKAIRIADNAKTHRYGTCNTMETLLLAHAIAPQVLPTLIEIYRTKGVELRVCPETRQLIERLPNHQSITL